MGMNMKAGYGAQKLPSPIGVELCGYGIYLKRICTGIGDELHVRCVATEKDGVKSLLLSADLIGLGDKPHAAIRELIADELGLSGAQVMIVCTHTHTGPSTNHLEGCGVESEAYNASIPPVFLEAAKEALGDMTDVESMETVLQPIEPIGYNRDTVNGPHDANVRGFLLRRTNAAPIALFSYACHPVAIGMRTTASADYPGTLCRMATAEGMKPIFVTGCCGDINPVIQRIKWGSGTQETLDDYATRILQGFKAGLKPVEPCGIELKITEFDATLPLRNLDADEIKDIADNSGTGGIGEVWKQEMLKRLPLPPTVTVKIRALKIGPLTLCSVPYETFTAVGDMVRAAFPGENIAVLGCADRTYSYLPVVTPGHERSYAIVSGSLLYLHPLFGSDAVERLADQIAKGISIWFRHGDNNIS
ncbi:MAG: hypothetical protein J5833_08535 [Victivallales bacterium]|nr:hypothetical protein [Victivallales bacterium]